MPDVTLNAFSTGYVPTRQQSARVTCLGTARQIAEEDLAVPLSELVLEPRAGPDPVDGAAAGLRQRCQAARRERHGLGRLGGRSARLRVVVPHRLHDEPDCERDQRGDREQGRDAQARILCELARSVRCRSPRRPASVLRDPRSGVDYSRGRSPRPRWPLRLTTPAPSGVVVVYHGRTETEGRGCASRPARGAAAARAARPVPRARRRISELV